MKRPLFISKPQRSSLLRYKFVYFLFFCLGTLSLKAQTYTFTTAGATGTVGPTQAQLNTAYLSTNLNGSVTMQGAGIQTFTVPQTGTYRIHAFGASGGYNGGYGANSVGDFTLTSGTVLKIVVGQVGSTAINGQNRGSGGGGGGSFVSTITNTPLVVAGGGGGYGDGYTSTTSNTPVCCIPEIHASLNTTANPCPGLANNGINGNGGSCGVSSAGAGSGFYSAGSGCAGAVASAQFTYTWGPLGGWIASGAGVGGYGGGGGGYSSGNGNRGGGGGGYSGGGGGDTPTSSASLAVGGGGGTYNAGINVTNALNTFTGNGRVTVESVCIVQIAAQGIGNFGNTICSGSTLTLTCNGIGAYNWSTGSSGTNSIVVSPTVTTIYTISAQSAYACLGTGSLQINVNSAAPAMTLTSSSSSICLGDNVIMNVSGGLTYSWTSPASHTTASFVANPTTTTTYSVIGYNTCGSTSSSISVQVVPLPVTALFTSTSICQTESVSLNVSSSATNYTIFPGNITGTNSAYIFSPSANSVYTVSGINGVCRGSATASIIVNPLPQISLSTTSTQLCSGTSAALTASGGVSYTWNVPGLSGSTALVTPTITTQYIITGANTYGCQNHSIVSINIKPNPLITLSQNATMVCAGKPATLTASGAQSYSWMPGNLSGSTVIATPSVNTIYTCTGTSSLNCTDTKTVFLAAYNPSVSVTAPLSICYGDTASIQAGSALSYSWNGQSGTAISLVTPTVNSVYILSALNNSLTVSCLYSVAITISVNPNPTVFLTNTSTNRCAGETNTIIAWGANTYSLNGVSTSTAFPISLVSTTTINVTGQDQEGCVNTATLAVIVKECVGIDELDNQEKINVFPNPSNGSITIVGLEKELLVLDLHGRLVLSVQINTDIPIQIDQLTPGIYMLYQKKSQMQFITKLIVYPTE